MKRKFSILFAALAAILLITPPHFITKAQGETTGSMTFGTDNVKINAASVTANDTQGNSWTITTEGTTSFTQNAEYSQVGSSKKPATSITFVGTLSESVNITSFSAKFGGFSGTAGTITLKVDGVAVGTGSLNASNDVIVESTPNVIGNELTIEVKGIAKGVKCYNLSYTYKTSSSPTITLLPTELNGFTYIGQGPSAAQEFTLQGSNLNGIVTLSAQEDYEISKTGVENSYSNNLSYEKTEINNKETTVYVRLKEGLQAGNYGGTITATSTNAEGQTITLSGEVYKEFNYNLVLQGSHISRAALKVDGTELQNNETIQFGKEVTVDVAVDEGYTYSVSVTNNTTQEYVEVIDNMFTMPASDITVTVTERALQNYTITYYVNGVVATTQNVIEGNAATLPTKDEITVPDGFNFVGWTKNEETAELIPQPFIPTENTNLYLVFGNTYYEKVKKLNDITAGTYIIVNADYCLPNSTTDSKTPPSKQSKYLVNNASSTDRYYSVPDNTEWTFTGTYTEMTITNSDGNYLYTTGANNGVRVYTTPDTWAFEENGTGFAMQENKTKRYCATYEAGDDWRSYTSKVHTNYADGGVLYLFKKSLYTRVYDASTTTQMENIPSTAVVNIPNGVVFTLTGTNKGSANNLIIEDGGQLIVNNSGVMATFKKSIEATPTAKATEGGWYSIASPVNNVAISSVTNFVDNADHSLRYNLYRYNETSSKWEAYNTTNHADFTTLANGQGYLYRNNGMELSFSGEVNHGDVRIALTNSATNTELKGFNLIGNPFGHNIYKGSGAAIDNNNLSEGFYYLTNNGAWQAGDGAKAITPKMGVLVQVTGEAFELTISDNNSQPNTRYANDNLQFIVSNNEYQDVAYAKFSKGYGLNKISHRNSEVPMLYIPQNDERYAIAMMSDNTEMFALNFKAATMGRYTLSYKAEGEFSYLHVIDRLTGDDVDMLLEGEYSFTASPKDNESRFIVRLAYKPDYSNEGNEMFVYQNGDEILVSGEGELQVFDATGRLVRNMSINGAKSLNISTQGVYIFRLVGNEVKTQKIVVR